MLTDGKLFTHGKVTDGVGIMLSPFFITFVNVNKQPLLSLIIAS